LIGYPTRPTIHGMKKHPHHPTQNPIHPIHTANFPLATQACSRLENFNQPIDLTSPCLKLFMIK
jgi:hypothetical protein